MKLVKFICSWVTTTTRKWNLFSLYTNIYDWSGNDGVMIIQLIRC